MSVNAGSRRQVQAASERELIDARLAAADLAEVMSTPVGRRFVFAILRSTLVDEPPRYVSNAMDLARDNGLRCVGAGLLADIRAVCPEQEFQMRQEYAALERRARLDEESNDER